ncbi:MAG: carbon monoxide dehydrogenase subunit G, partial [Rhodospirillaceae bacterium]|nr:carbon monoxide dehydrogenase subunit G [Rhodospirillaceae bacterium]
YTRLGAKGIAEGNQYTTPVCIANAVADALGAEDIELPLKPAKVLEWVQAEEPPPSAAVAPEGAAGEPAGPTVEGSGEMQVPAPPEQVWSMLLDPERMARIVPGCERLEAAGENGFAGAVVLGAGPVRGRFEARIDLTDLEKPHRARLAGTADGPLGSSRGEGAFELIAQDGGTLVRYRYSVELTGKVAAVGGRMVRGAARQLIDRFLRALVREAGGEADPGSSGGLSARLKRLVGGRA